MISLRCYPLLPYTCCFLDISFNISNAQSELKTLSICKCVIWNTFKQSNLFTRNIIYNNTLLYEKEWNLNFKLVIHIWNRPPFKRNIIRSPIIFILILITVTLALFPGTFLQLSRGRFLNNGIYSYFACIKNCKFSLF